MTVGFIPTHSVDVDGQRMVQPPQHLDLRAQSTKESRADPSYYVSTVEDLGVHLSAEVISTDNNSWLQSVEQTAKQKLAKN